MLYGALFLLALWINKGSSENLLITLLVGFSYYFPYDQIHNHNLWYLTCIIMEISKILFARIQNTQLQWPIGILCLLMLSNHIISYIFKNTVPIYHFNMVYLEHLEILCCIIFSHTIINKLKGFVKCRLPSKQLYIS